MTFNLEYAEETTQKRLAFSAGELVPLGIDDLLSLHGKLCEPVVFPLRLQGAWVASRLGVLMPSKTRPTSLVRLRVAQTQIALGCQHKCEAAHMRIYADDQRCHEVARGHDKQEPH